MVTSAVIILKSSGSETKRPPPPQHHHHNTTTTNNNNYNYSTKTNHQHVSRNGQFKRFLYHFEFHVLVFTTPTNPETNIASL